MPIVNGHQAETGCYIDGHWGQYGPDRLADIAEGLGWPREDPGKDPRYWRKVADRFDAMADRGHPNPDMERRYRDRAVFAWEQHTESADAIERWLNDHTAVVCAECGHLLDPVTHPDAPAEWASVTDGTLWCDGRPHHYHAAQRFVWHWSDGEFFLSPICDDPDECEDETCAHWD